MENKKRLTGLEIIKRFDDTLGTNLYDVEMLKYDLEDMDFKVRKDYEELHPEIKESRFGIGTCFRTIAWRDIPALRDMYQRLTGANPLTANTAVFEIHLHCLKDPVSNMEARGSWLELTHLSFPLSSVENFYSQVLRGLRANHGTLFGQLGDDTFQYKLTYEQLSDLTYDPTPAIKGIENFVKELISINETAYSEKAKELKEQHMKLNKEIVALQETAALQRAAFVNILTHSKDMNAASSEWKV